MKTYRRVDTQTHVLLTSALDGREWSASRPGLFTPGKRAASTHWTGGWTSPRAGLDTGPYRDLNSEPSVVQAIASRYSDSSDKCKCAESKLCANTSVFKSVMYVSTIVDLSVDHNSSTLQ
jgi:hypothetical protein